MLMQFILTCLIVLATLFWTWQGAYSAALMLLAALFASAMAIGVHEWFVPLLAQWRPDYARPLAFFLLFAFVFSVLRLTGGWVVPRRIRLPLWLDLSLGGAFGFLLSMIAFGTLLIGVEMLPGHQIIFGYDRYPQGFAKDVTTTLHGALTVDATSLTGADASVFPKQGPFSVMVDSEDMVVNEVNGTTFTVTRGANGSTPAAHADGSRIVYAPPVSRVWLPGRRTCAMDLCQFCGGSLGGQPLDTVYPDLERELYGYRHVVTFGSNPVVPEALSEVPAVFVLKSPAAIGRLVLRKLVVNEDEELVVVRSQVTKGVTRPQVTQDADGYYRITPTQVRLVVSQGDQTSDFYPVGYLEKGQYFVPWQSLFPQTSPLDAAHLVQGYGTDKADKALIVNDWVFKIPATLRPAL